MRDSKYFDDCIIVVYVGVNDGSVGGHALAIWHTKAPQLRLQNVAPDQLQGGYFTSYMSHNVQNLQYRHKSGSVYH